MNTLSNSMPLDMKNKNDKFSLPLIINPESKKDSIFSVLYQKFLEWLRKSKMSTILCRVAEVFLVVGVAFMLTSPKIALASFAGLFAWKGYFLLKFIGSYVLVRKRSRIKSLFIRWSHSRESETLEGISKEKLLYFLIEKQSFKLEDTKNAFGIHRKLHDRIAKKLEKIRILVRGDKNARILAPGISNEMLSEMLNDAECVKTLSRPLQIVRSDARNFRTTEEIEREFENNFTNKAITKEGRG